ncbi:hypothetical protein J2Z76_002972 [Sedimentibacter acidaminivorans]|uniref:Uncharacterized protein n=1 Tax=Sedimentibacter acidaminivorans TaxID=913099 RepID=A0ABS4GHH2_9FIRM|nr:hypothetical protein [Sedimentibacter acidaminivorans]MBP1927099.1 hypothetical protein [Sedimentibacter acidaminivorans]
MNKKQRIISLTIGIGLLYGRNDIVAITSSKEKRDGIVDLKRIEREDETYETIIKENKLPNDVNILLTTTKLREGVNIEDYRIKECISGCHSSVDIRQFAGRVRAGIETLYIVDDKKQNRNNINRFELDASSKLIEKFDEVIVQYTKWGFGINKKPYAMFEDCKRFYEMMEKRFSLIKFDRYNNKFEIYNQRIIGCEKEEKDLDSFNTNTCLYLGSVFGEGINIILNGKKLYDNGIKEKGRLLLQDYIGKPLNSEEMNILLKELTQIGLRGTKNQVYKSFGAVVTYLGYKLESYGNKNNGLKIINIKVK